MVNFLNGLQIGLLILSATASCFYLVCMLATLQFWKQRQDEKDSHSLLPVSVLIPVRGVDEGAIANWMSFCSQDYPTYEVLFGVMDTDDPAVPILKNLVAQFPNHTRLLNDLPARGINHQISNLSYLVEAAQYEQVIFADSDIRVTSMYLREVIPPLANSKIGVVTCGYLDKTPKFLGAAIAALGRGIDFLPSILIARILDGGLKFALGPTIATRKSVLQAIGGLDMVMNRIGSDFHIGRLASEAGYKVELSHYVLDNDCGEETVKQVYQRELRWSRTIRINRGNQYYGLIFSYGTVYATFLLMLTGFQPWAIAVSLSVYSLRVLQAIISIQALRCPKLLLWLWALPVRDALSFGIWVLGGFGQKIFWRGRWLEIGRSGLLREKV
jgi:ceramide glucosyltransferase